VATTKKSNVLPADEAVRVPIVYEIVVDEIELSPYGGFKPIEAALLTVAHRHSKLGEEANGTYRFAIPDYGHFRVELEFEPNDDSVVAFEVES